LRSQCTARAVSESDQFSFVNAQFRGTLGCPAPRSKHIVSGSRETVLGSKAIVQRQYAAIRLGRQHAANPVITADTAQRKTTPVREDHERSRVRGRSTPV